MHTKQVLHAHNKHDLVEVKGIQSLPYLPIAMIFPVSFPPSYRAVLAGRAAGWSCLSCESAAHHGRGNTTGLCCVKFVCKGWEYSSRNIQFIFHCSVSSSSPSRATVPLSPCEEICGLWRNRWCFSTHLFCIIHCAQSLMFIQNEMKMRLSLNKNSLQK